MADPIFPPEIEHIIFTSAVKNQNLRPFPINLILVARRVYEWLIPVIYRTISLQEGHEYPIQWDAEKLAKYGIYARHLFVWKPSSHFRDTPQATKIPLVLCPNVTDLLWWPRNYKADTGAISHLPLTHLSILLNIVQQTPHMIQTFSNITHLDNIGSFTDDITLVNHFTSLTHLSVHGNDGRIPRFFEKLPGLQVLINYSCRAGITSPILRDFDPDKDDPRLVRMIRGTGGFEHWLADINGGRGMWGLAEEAIEMRKKGRDSKAS
ncbi:hypothetical protein BDN72DRAFT_962829 [Pluteus cervinus]|uniref:Uncharacterized protein n=1 Tax=Pluteus cervinus TaxID=181527 RepID=A0ACD3AGL4_9AGAR|nr:hypothetical protein BDN72DRAFT_962829 [Pluteus cervinus]